MGIKKVLKLILGATFLFVFLAPSLRADGIIPADSPLIRYSGRVLTDKTHGAIFDWPGVSIEVSVKGTEAGFLINGDHNNLEVKADGRPVTTWVCGTSLAPYWVKGLSPGWHEIQIVKRTEGLFGAVLFKGLMLDAQGEARNPAPPPPRRIEIIGDSWVCGYGDEGTTFHCKKLRPYENADRAFGALAAEVHLTAYSGRGVVRNYGDHSASSKIPYGALFGRTLVQSPDYPWDFSQWVPDVVVIHLGLNDFSTKPHPTPAAFIEGYQRLIQKVRAAYPQAWILCFATTGWPYFSPLVQEASDSFNRWGDRKVLFVGYPSVPLSDLGCDYHPKVVAHQRLADILVPVIRRCLGWK